MDPDNLNLTSAKLQSNILEVLQHWRCHSINRHWNSLKAFGKPSFIKSVALPSTSAVLNRLNRDRKYVGVEWEVTAVRVDPKPSYFLPEITSNPTFTVFTLYVCA